MSGAIPLPLGGFADDMTLGDLDRSRRRPSSAAARDAVGPTTSDHTLLTRARAGDRAAFGLLVERHHRALTAVLYQRLGPRAPVEDLLQDVFAKALTHIEGFERRSSFFTWAVSIALNRATDWQRKRARRRRLAPPADVDADHVSCSRAQRTLDRVEARDDAHRAREALGGLPELQRLAVTLRVVEELPYADIAARLDVPAQRVRTWVSRGLKRLRIALTGDGQAEVS